MVKVMDENRSRLYGEDGKAFGSPMFHIRLGINRDQGMDGTRLWTYALDLPPRTSEPHPLPVTDRFEVDGDGRLTARYGCHWCGAPMTCEHRGHPVIQAPREDRRA